MDKREEMLAWAKSLKPGDKVILKSNNYFRKPDISTLEFKKLTPSGWVQTTNGQYFVQSNNCERFFPRGRGIGEILPATPELLEEAERQDAEREDEKRKKQVILKAKNILFEKHRLSGNMTYEKATKILEFFKELDGE